MRPRHSAAVIAAVTAAVTACGGDDGGPNPTLSQQEAGVVAQALFVEMSNALGDLTFDGVAAARAPAAQRLAVRLRASAAPRPATATLGATSTASFSGACARGGRIVGSYTLTDDLSDEGSGSVSGEMTWKPEGCVVSTGSRTLTIDGDPSLRYTYSATRREYEPVSDWTMRASGGFTWNGGRCDMDYVMTFSPEGRYTIAGRMCGQDVSASSD